MGQLHYKEATKITLLSNSWSVVKKVYGRISLVSWRQPDQQTCLDEVLLVKLHIRDCQ